MQAAGRWGRGDGVGKLRSLSCDSSSVLHLVCTSASAPARSVAALIGFWGGASSLSDGFCLQDALQSHDEGGEEK
ncbi:MAG: hypothetical protein QXS54_07100 [Candidatus Methanomethylicaceae archaeon]